MIYVFDNNEYHNYNIYASDSNIIGIALQLWVIW